MILLGRSLLIYSMYFQFVRVVSEVKFILQLSITCVEQLLKLVLIHLINNSYKASLPFLFAPEVLFVSCTLKQN